MGNIAINFHFRASCLCSCNFIFTSIEIHCRCMRFFRNFCVFLCSSSFLGRIGRVGGREKEISDSSAASDWSKKVFVLGGILSGNSWTAMVSFYRRARRCWRSAIPSKETLEFLVEGMTFLPLQEGRDSLVFVKTWLCSSRGLLIHLGLFERFPGRIHFWFL